MAGSQRIEALRRQFLASGNPSVRSEEGELLFLRSWAANRRDSQAIRAAKAKADMLRGQTPVIWDGELVVGKPCYRQLTEAESAELSALRRAHRDMADAFDGQASHMAVDYEKLLRLGCTGVLEEIRARRSMLDLKARPHEVEQDEFYASCEIVLHGLMDYAARYAAHARRLAEAASPERAAELRLIADDLETVPSYPAKTFRQAVQSVHILTVNLEGLYQLGRPDRYLYPYYMADKAAGVLSDDDAQEWLDCLCLKYNEYVSKSLAAGFMICGRDKDGHDVTNELSYLLLESIDHTRLSYPGVSVCWNPDTPNRLLRRAVELLGKGYSHPPIFNDDLIIRGLKSYGVPADEACEYVQSTCVEITVCKSSTAWVASPYVNLVAPLLEELSCDAPDFATFKANYFRRLYAKLTADVEEQNRQQYQRARTADDALCSCFVNDCLATGKDLNRGGGRYRHIMPSFVGMANLVDSLLSVEALVYNEKRMTLAELKELVSSDFAGCEPLRQEILNRIPKYGNDDAHADELAKEVTEWIAESCTHFSTYLGARIIPSMFCWIMHDRLGRETGATPDGRAAYFPLGDGSGPAQGREKHGATASVLSSTKWEHERFIGGIAVNLKFGKSMFTADSVPKLEQLVRTYLERGGFEVQINVVDRETLLAAQAHPEDYQDLVVRIGGYSDYFVNLPLSMQQEVLMRTEHEL